MVLLYATRECPDKAAYSCLVAQDGQLKSRAAENYQSPKDVKWKLPIALVSLKVYLKYLNAIAMRF